MSDATTEEAASARPLDISSAAEVEAALRAGLRIGR